MTDVENKGAAKPQSDWDGDIIPRELTACQSELNIPNTMIWVQLVAFRRRSNLVER